MSENVDDITTTIYDSLVGTTNPYLTTVYLHRIVGNTSILIEEKAVQTVGQFCEQIKNADPLDKINFVRGVYSWSGDAAMQLSDDLKLAHIDGNPDNIAIFEVNGQYRLKYIDLDSLVRSTDTIYTITSFDMDVMMSILFD